MPVGLSVVDPCKEPDLNTEANASPRSGQARKRRTNQRRLSNAWFSFCEANGSSQVRLNHDGTSIRDGKLGFV